MKISGERWQPCIEHMHGDSQKLMSDTAPTDPTREKSRAGQLWLASMGLFLVLAGLLFAGVLWRSYSRAMETRLWKPTPCRIVSSVILTEKPSLNSTTVHRLGIRYEYDYEGEKLTGTKVKRVEGPTPHKDKIEALAAEFPSGRSLTCYVNPSQPSEAILLHASKAAVYAIWFPLLFVLGGGMIAVRALRSRQK